MPISPDCPVLANAIGTADAIAALFRPFVEAVVHDLRSDAVTHVANPFSPRTIGDPSDLGEIRFAPDAVVIGPYDKVNFDGRRLRSISVVQRDDAGTPRAMLCINADVTEFDALRRLLGMMLGGEDVGTSIDTAFHEDWHERINRFVAAWTAQHGLTIARLDREQRRALIAAIRDSGGLERKHAAAYVARMLGVSRATLYNELARVRDHAA